jgi:hypothetical protein
MSIERKADSDRDRFEAHYRKVRGDVPSYVFDKGLSNGRYFVLAVQIDWELWKTAIEASGRDDLLEALERIEREFNDSPLDGELAYEMYKIAQAAIAKAKGES